MRSNFIRLHILILIIYTMISFSACNLESGMEKKLLFELTLGRGEDQIDLIQMANVPFNKKSRIVMKDGLIYIGNGNSNKVMEFNSYGDILSLHYNPKENPEPVLLTNTNIGGQSSNRNAYPFNFRNIGEIAVTNQNHVLIEDTVPDNRSDYDESTDSTLNRIVLRFDNKGNFINFLGREGIGGTPFPYIEKIEVNNNDEIIIITRTIKTWNIYWFSDKGSLKYTVIIPLDNLPVPSEGDFIPSLETIVPDRNENSVYLKIDYYNKKNNDLDYTMSYIWILDLKKESYIRFIRMPELNIDESDDISGFLGVNNAGKFFFLTYISDNISHVMVLDKNGTVLTRSELTMLDEKISYRDMYLDSNGLLVALLGKYDKAEVVWWRSDQLAGVQNEDS
ncbi:MAG: hypothetical protein PF693_18170 [Spirochaetia bacterium]|jgi:hypothetical protein|nr:hypothetical protein [Spirochaetia bacterium]